MARRRDTDNIIIAKEMVHMMAQKCRKRKMRAIKLNVHKAYDSISWISSLLLKPSGISLWSSLTEL